MTTNITASHPRRKMLCASGEQPVSSAGARENAPAIQPLAEPLGRDAEGMQPHQAETLATAPRKRPSLSKKQRARILAKSQGNCIYCGQDRLRHGVPIEVDHFIPLSRGGPNTQSNLVAACKWCNAEKGDMLVDEYRAYIIEMEGVGWWMFDYENTFTALDTEQTKMQVLGVQMGLITQQECDLLWRLNDEQEARHAALKASA